MKFTIFLIAFMVSVTALADNCSEQSSEEQATEVLKIDTATPEHLKGAKITVTLADGTTSTVPAEKFKVVARQQQFIVTKLEKSKVVRCSKEQNKNRVAVMAGEGPSGSLSKSVSGTTTKVETDKETVGGVQYQRLLNDRWSLGVQGQSNGSGSVLLGLDF